MSDRAGGARPHGDLRLPVRERRRSRLARSIAAVAVATAIGIAGYMILGLSLLEATYQTVITVTTVGYREIGFEEQEVDTAYQLFTTVFVFIGVGSALYMLTVVFETLVDGRLEERFGRRRMEREIARLQDHVVVCGAGRVGRVLAEQVAERGRALVVIDHDPDHLAAAAELGAYVVEGDARLDDVLERAGIGRAASLVTALTTDADNVYVTLAARAVRPDLFIVSRAQSEDAEGKLRVAGADRVVNPQYMGGHRMATFALQPNVAEFLDVVMHDGGLEWRIEEVALEATSELVGSSLQGAELRRRTGAMVLALREVGAPLVSNPRADTVLREGTVLVVMGTPEELVHVERLGAGRRDAS